MLHGCLSLGDKFSRFSFVGYKVMLIIIFFDISLSKKKFLPSVALSLSHSAIIR